MRIMEALTPTERATKRVDELLTARERIDAEMRDLLAFLDNGPARKRSRLVVPECGSETSYQKHRHARDTADDKRVVTCEPCLEGHRRHNRVRYAAAKLRKAS